MIESRPQRMVGSWVLSTCLAVSGAALLAQDIVINEVHYDPPDRTLLEEFIELYNAGGTADVSGWYFANGIHFTFPEGATIPAGAYVVLAQDPDDFRDRFGFNPDFGPYEGRLAGDGERLVLRTADGGLADQVDYGLGFPWPIASGGKGSSMELLDPALDNDLGSSWRASGYSESEPIPPIILLAEGATGWRYRKGTSEASSPVDIWREPGFSENGSWLTGRTPVGYGDGDDNTTLGDMQNSYMSVYLRRTFDIADLGALPATVRLRVYVDDGAIVWLNGAEVARAHVGGGQIAFNGAASNHEAAWEEFDIPRSRLVSGTNLIAIHALNTTLGSSDFSIDAALLVPGTSADDFGPPTPGEVNSVLTTNAAPQIRQVAHGPTQPRSGQDFAVIAKVTDPDGVASVRLFYQVVAPGNYLPAFLPLPHSTLLSDPDRDAEPNPAFEDPANWMELAMVDDGSGIDQTAGDSIYTVVLPGQANRTLVRYRIEVADALGASSLVPYRDDRGKNFAAFVYNGVPDYTAATRTVQSGGVPYTYPRSDLTVVPVYHVLTRAADMTHCISYDSATRIPKSNEGARDRFNWEGAFVYEGKVYDHIRYRLRQANDRYGGSGKRSMRFRFNKGNYLEARDAFGKRYPTVWRTLNTGKGFDNKRVGNFGVTEVINNTMWNMVGVPAPWMHHIHLRVIDSSQEAPAGTNGQYFGDFWGLYIAVEDYDTRFLDAHDLEDGNLYKLKDGQFNGNDVKRHQGRFAVTTDQDFQTIRNMLRPERTSSWLRDHVNYDRWYHYHAVVEGIRHYDFRPADSHMKNRAWYFEPNGLPLGRLWTLPHDADASWGPNWNSGEDYSKAAIHNNGGKPEFLIEYRNTLRSFRDLLWTRESIGFLIDDVADRIAQFARADRDRWRNAPPEAGSQDFGSLEAKLTDMFNFAFTGWSGSTGPTVGAGGRARHLENLANAGGESGQIPQTPLIVYTGPDGFPIDRLEFANTAFQDPQGAATFGAREWRIAEVTDESAPAFDPTEPRVYEWTSVWSSGDLPGASEEFSFPVVARVGHTYRVRLRMRDSSGRYSHWSDEVEFTAEGPSTTLPVSSWLRVSEIMYNAVGGGSFEYIELQNTGPTTLDLRGVEIGGGIQFEFLGSAIESLAPGEFVVIVSDLEDFEDRYDTSDMMIAGTYEGRLDDGGEEILVTIGESVAIQNFIFDDVWYVVTDGLGPSLEIIDPGAPVGSWNTAAAWQPSAEATGTPGTGPSGLPPGGGFRVPADANVDGRVDVSDAYWLARALFAGVPVSMPCDGEALEDSGNVDILDSDGDGSVGLTDVIRVLEYLFQSGPAPALGTRCQRIEGCDTFCAD